MDRTDEQVIQEIYELIKEWKQSKPSDQEILHPSRIDGYGFRYPHNPNKDLVKEAYDKLQEYRRSMSAGLAITLDEKLAEAALLKRQQEARTQLHIFHATHSMKAKRRNR